MGVLEPGEGSGQVQEAAEQADLPQPLGVGRGDWI